MPLASPVCPAGFEGVFGVRRDGEASDAGQPTTACARRQAPFRDAPRRRRENAAGGARGPASTRPRLQSLHRVEAASRLLDVLHLREALPDDQVEDLAL